MKFDCQGPFDALAMVEHDGDLLPAVSELAGQVGRGAASAITTDVGHDVAQRALSAAMRAAREIATLRERIERLEQLVTTDELTGVLNRRGFEAELKRVLDLAHRHGETGVLLFVDLDGFKKVNDFYGHAAGDAVLREVAALLKRNVRRSDIVARIGGDEFVVLLTKACVVGGASRRIALERVLQSTVVRWNDQVINIGASVGGRAYGPCDHWEALIEDADQRMYAQKADRHHGEARVKRSTGSRNHYFEEPLPACLVGA